MVAHWRGGAAKGSHRRGGSSFTGPAEFYADGPMTCHRVKAVMR